jgi:5-methylcytosine-specific restriction endonuclease McrA
MRRSKYDAALLAPVVESSRTLAQVIRKLGLRPTGGNYRYIKGRIRKAGLDTSHFGGAIRIAIESVPVETLQALVQESLSIAQVLAALGLPTEGRAHDVISQRIALLGLDTAHLRGRGWSRGETKVTHPSVASGSRKRALSDDDLFVERSSRVNSGPSIIERLLAKGWAYQCAHCGISNWRGQPLVLHLDHINGVASDNRLSNLRLLCPNCHSQTPTYCNRSRPAGASAREPRGMYTCYTSPRTRAWRNW